MALQSGQLVEAYRRDGYLCPVDLFSSEEAAGHRAALEAHEAQYSSGGLPRPIDQYQRINMAMPDGNLTPRELDMYEVVLRAQSATLADGATGQVSFYETA